MILLPVSWPSGFAISLARTESRARSSSCSTAVDSTCCCDCPSWPPFVSSLNRRSSAIFVSVGLGRVGPTSLRADSAFWRSAFISPVAEASASGSTSATEVRAFGAMADSVNPSLWAAGLGTSTRSAGSAEAVSGTSFCNSTGLCANCSSSDGAFR